MIGIEPLILFGIILALALNFVNGLNDASHSIATVVATKALSPAKAVFLTAICNMIGPYLFTTAVAATIGTAIVTTECPDPVLDRRRHGSSNHPRLCGNPGRDPDLQQPCDGRGTARGRYRGGRIICDHPALMESVTAGHRSMACLVP